MPFSKFYSGRTVLVTGASSGLGREMARKLAVDYGARVVATARRAEKLADLQSEVEAAGGTLEAYSFDVTDSGAMPALVAHCKNANLDGIILNAGVTFADNFQNGSAAVDEGLIATNVTANVHLIRALLPILDSRPGARIQIVASMAGLVPTPYQAVYSGTKAFLINFGAALREELKQSNINICVFAPGGIATAMTDIDAMDNVRGFLAPVGKVAEAAIDQFESGRALVVPGVGNATGALLARFLPRSFLAHVLARQYRPR